MNKRYLGYRTCSSCEFEFLPVEEDQATCKLCSVATSTKGSVRILRKSAPLEQHCCWCRAPFEPSAEHRRYCSADCARKADNARNAIYYRHTKKARVA